jgi:hypothetical protein
MSATEVELAALAYARRGLYVFPTAPASKAPDTAHGFHDATLDEAAIRRWYADDPRRGVAIATGPRSGVFGIDVDDLGALVACVDRFGPLPPTAATHTPRGGLHLVLRYPLLVDVPSRTDWPVDGIDVRGSGGYLVAPPTTLANGSYRWAEHGSASFADAPPDWLRALARTPATQHVAAPVTDWRAMVAGAIPEGRRNSSLTRLVGHLLRRDVDALVVRGLALAVNARSCRPPLDDHEVERIVDSIAARELRRRRVTP